MFKKILVLFSLFAFLCANAYGGTVTPASVKHTNWGNKRVTYGTLVITGAPGALGYTVTAANLQLRNVERLIVYPDYAYPGYDWTWSRTSASSGYLVPMRQGWLDKKQVIAAGSTDTISVCLMKAGDWASDNDTVVVLVSPLSGGLARIHAPLPAITTGALASAGIQYPLFTAGDGLTIGSVADTGLAGGPVLRATNTTGSYYRGDTLYYLPNETDPNERLAYSGRSVLGAAVAGTYADLYVPFGQGNYIKVRKIVSGDMTTAVPLYFAPKGALKYKFVASKAAGRATYLKPITPDRVPTTSSGFTTILYFVAFGN